MHSRPAFANRALLCGAGLLALAASPALATGITPGSASVTIPFDMPAGCDPAGGRALTCSPNLDIRLGSGAPIRMLMDTGSTGIVVGSNYFDTTGKTKSGSGYQVWNSTGIKILGDFYMTRVTIGSGANTAIAEVPVLVATSQECLPGARHCTPSSHPQPLMFGVGFGQEKEGQPFGLPSHNPFLNIIEINGSPVTSATPTTAGSYTSGYIVGATGVTLGLTAANTAGFNLLKLTWSETWQNWERATGALSISSPNGALSSGTGTILPDTGVSVMYVTPASGDAVQTTSPYGVCANGPCLLPGSVVTVTVGGLAAPIAQYSFTVGADGGPAAGSTPAAPGYVTVDGAASATYVNTTFDLFNAFHYLYSYVDGVVGLQAIDPLPMREPATAALFGAGLLGLIAVRRQRRP